jgi:hypothetical protein
MKTLVKAAFVLLVVQIFLFSGTAIANTLSDTYYQAFVDPHGFDGYLNDNVVLDPDYYGKFENCVQLAIRLLNEMEEQERQRYSTCPNNAACTQIAKNIQSITALQLNVKNLGEFVRATDSNAQLRFLNSEIGRAALTVYNIHTQMGIDIRRNPEFVKEVGTLSGIPCQ